MGKVLISNRILFKKIAIMHRRAEFFKIKRKHLEHSHRSFKNMQYFTKTSRILNTEGHVYFKTALSHTIYQPVAYLKTHTIFYTDISIAKGLLSDEMFRFSDDYEIQGENESVT